MEESGHTLNPGLDQPNLYQRKYYALKRKCEEVQQTNEKLVNRIQHVKRILRRRQKEKKLIISKLDEYGDAYLDVKLPAMFDDVETEKLDVSLSGQNENDANRHSQLGTNSAVSSSSTLPFFVTSQINPSVTSS